ncbi:hypothetical protein K457DRAFT_37927, partial [Linnemannia elongata AG-77]
IIRSSSGYKRKQYMKFRALMDSKGTPTLFGTFTCNVAKPIYRNLMKQFYGNTDDMLKDPYLLSRAFQRDWQDFFDFVRSTWAGRYCGKVTAYCWVIEFQSRGLPHAHFCLWTQKTIEEMIELKTIVATVPRGDEDQYFEEMDMWLSQLVRKHQVHGCGKYCDADGRDAEQGSINCRFKFPKEPHYGATKLDARTNRFVYHRGAADSRINTYN